VKEADCSENTTYSCMENGKMRHVEAIPGMEGRGNSTRIYCKKFYKCHNASKIQQ
jgi:hypothetical protein